MTGSAKAWHQWAPDGEDPSSVLIEIARHMKSAWDVRDDPGSTRFKAGHQLAHKGWKFATGVVDLSDGTATSGIKALRGLIIAGKHSWFERAAALGQGQPVTPMDAPSQGDRQHLAALLAVGTPLRRFDVGEAEIWMALDSAGWRVVGIYVRDAAASGIKEVMQLAAATRGGCLLVGLAVAALALMRLAWTALGPGAEVINGAGDRSVRQKHRIRRMRNRF